MGDGRAHQVLAVAVTFLVLSWLTVGARIWVRAGMIDQFGRDDGTMLVTQLLFTAYLICQLEGVVYGTGQHLIDLEPWRAEKALKVSLTFPKNAAASLSHARNSSGISARYFMRSHRYF